MSPRARTHVPSTNRAACFDVPKHHANLWQEYAEDSAPAEVSRVGTTGDARAAGFREGFLPELHHVLYAETPREIPACDVKPAAAVRAKLHALANELPEFGTLRKQTTRDPLWSGMAATAIGDSVARALPARSPGDKPSDADRARDLLDGLQGLAQDNPEASEALAGHIASAESAATLAEECTATDAASLDESRIRNALRAGIASAASAIDDAQACMSAFGWGDSAGCSSTPRDSGVAVELARRVAGSAKLKRIVDLAGRLTMTARAKRAARTEYARSEVVGVEPTGDVQRLLGSELALLDDPVMGDDLLIRLIEKRALGYKMAGKEPCKKGPIVLMLDQSGSMQDEGKDDWAKAIALALLDAARADKRAFGIILYNARVAEAKLFPVASEADPRVLLDLLSCEPDGGTQYRSAMTQALDWISVAGTFKSADVVHITDGAASTNGAEDAKTRAKGLGVTIFGIAIGHVGPALAAWSDEVTEIRDVKADDAAVDLIFDAI